MTDASPENSDNSNSPSVSHLPTTIIRILTGLFFIPISLFLIIHGGWLLLAGLLFLSVVGLLEFLRMKQVSGQGVGVITAGLLLIALYRDVLPVGIAAVIIAGVCVFIMQRFHQQSPSDSLNNALMMIMGLLYTCLPFALMLALRTYHPDGVLYVLAALFATWGTDISAYAVGRAIGQTPFFPRLSPSKTLEGAIGGVVGGFLAGIAPFLLTHTLIVGTLILALIAPFVAIAGDLFASALKRAAQIKDSGIPGLNPFPGHGGVLDRVDALLAVLTLFYVWQWFYSIGG